LLISPINEEEVKEAVYQMGGDKALGPDGFSLVFFLQFWDIFREDIMLLMDQFQKEEVNLARINQAMVCLIPPGG
jgi:hypothetical protein